MTVVINN